MPHGLFGETVFYQKDEILITNIRAVFGKTTYPIANISSVSLDRKPTDQWALWFLVLGGIGLFGVILFWLIPKILKNRRVL